MEKDLIEENKKINEKYDAEFQKGFQDVIAQGHAVKEYFELLQKEGETLEETSKISPLEQYKRLRAIKLSLANHEETVQQNRDLQKELDEKNQKIKRYKMTPFFPYMMNDGNRTDFGEFYLISHAWFSFFNTPQQIGIVEVEYKTPGNPRKIYIGISSGKPTPEGFNESVLSIAKYGQKIKDSSDEF